MKKIIKANILFYKIIFLILISLLISGCRNEKKTEITFISDDEIEYTRDFKVSSLIEKVDNYTKDEFAISDDDSVITLPNNKTVMVNYKNKDIKLDTIEFNYKYLDNIYSKKILIKDTTPPKIECKDSYDVQIGNEYFILKNLISCSDNYTDEQNIELFFNGNYDINKKGKYIIEIIAYDEKKNKETREVTVNIVENEVNDDYTKPSSSEQSNNHNSTNSNSNSTSSQSNSNNITKPKKSSYIPESKSFTIDTYSTFDECFSACESYINECIAKGYVGKAKLEVVKKDGLNFGYRAVFS